MSAATAVAGGFVLVTVWVTDPDGAEHEARVSGEPTAAEGLCVTPAVCFDPADWRTRYSGSYRLTHADSGRVLPFRAAPGELHEVATRLAEVDWTRPYTQLKTDPHVCELVVDEHAKHWF